MVTHSRVKIGLTGSFAQVCQGKEKPLLRMSKGDAPIKPLIAALSFIKDKIRWGYIFRTVLFEINHDDFLLISNEMGANWND